LTARTREFAQVGVEILGKSGVQGDIEAVLLAIEALRAAGLTDFLIDIGHIDFFYGILSGLGLTEPETADLKRCIGLKDAFGTEALLSDKKMPEENRRAFKSLSALYGGAEALDEAERLAFNPTMRSAVGRLREIVGALKSVGYEQYVSVDFGLLKDGYYSGFVMRGLAKNLGVSILDGGRYDFLGDVFGKPHEAVGFAIGVKRLLIALEKQGSAQKPPPCDYAYINLDGFSADEFERIDNLRKEGKRMVKLYSSNEEQLRAYCTMNKIKAALVFNGAKVKEINL